VYFGVALSPMQAINTCSEKAQIHTDVRGRDSKKVTNGHKTQNMILEPEKKIFLDTSSTNIDTLVPSLYQCVETRGTEVF
jgi:hypothetical protein